MNENHRLQARVSELEAVLRHLLHAVTFGPRSELTPGNLGYRARVPVGFVETAERALAGEDKKPWGLSGNVRILPGEGGTDE